MKRLMLAVAVAAIVSSSSGCCLLDRLFHNVRGYPLNGQCGPQGCPTGACSACGGVGCNECAAAGGHHGLCRGGICHGGGLGRGYGARNQRNMGRYAGPTMSQGAGAVAYPYYTVRGPRDYFADDPPSIGP